MKKTSPLSAVLELSVPERIIAVEDIWDSIAKSPKSIKITRAQKKELDRRLESHRRNPTAGSPWPEVKKRLLAG